MLSKVHFMQCIERKRMSICYDSFNGVNDMYHYNNGISKINENILLEKKECVSFENKIKKIKDYLTYQRGLEIDIKEMIYMIRGQHRSCLIRIWQDYMDMK